MCAAVKSLLRIRNGRQGCRFGGEVFGAEGADIRKLATGLDVLGSNAVHHLNRLLMRSLISGVLSCGFKCLKWRCGASDHIRDAGLWELWDVHHLMLLLGNDLGASADGGCGA
ncbi:hypothetical protein KGQ20_45880 [Catenulispora sp. NF23]|uniref:Uncharacterized protein n=1 Tax=Catenulispora pinistramenti TaxID=2705254 RepID=A0ABS5L8J5_9ACTN|nr:hypothetical protein [Catenulispora pinistramenti]MBS2540094.1 hypothetical protein [Catenulispora pinistramenti]MBS2554668.1 hypothetical protein [Catenulispora pinistramenti]